LYSERNTAIKQNNGLLPCKDRFVENKNQRKTTQGDGGSVPVLAYLEVIRVITQIEDVQ
jgi:hypothetical protein